MRLVSLGVFLFIFWLVLSGHYKPHLIVIGILSCLLCVYLAKRMDILDEEGHPAHLLLRAPSYLSWLTLEIVKSAISVSKIILDPKLPISPTMIDVSASQKRPIGVATYGNSITLTPGTITVFVSGNTLKVHALTKEGAEDLQGGEMDRRVTQFEGEG